MWFTLPAFSVPSMWFTLPAFSVPSMWFTNQISKSNFQATIQYFQLRFCKYHIERTPYLWAINLTGFMTLPLIYLEDILICDPKKKFAKIMQTQIFDTNSNFLFPISLQPDGVNL